MKLEHTQKAFGNVVNVLIIDDHPLFREGLQFVLSDLSEGLCFNDAVGLGTISEETLHSADLILLDLGISDSEGYETLAKLRALDPTGSIVIISSDDDPVTVRKCIEGGAAGFIPKTSQPQVLITALRLVLAGGIYLPPNSMGEVPSDVVEENDTLSKLTPRQRMALLLAGRGLPNKSIAIKMGITEGTVKLHLSATYKLLGVKNRTEAVFIISRAGLTIQQAELMPDAHTDI